jgi:hypothetical protein
MIDSLTRSADGTHSFGEIGCTHRCSTQVPFLYLLMDEIEPAYDEEAINEFRAREFSRLDPNSEIYSDYVGDNPTQVPFVNASLKSWKAVLYATIPHR